MAKPHPHHPGAFILSKYMEPFNISCRYLAQKLDVAPSTLSRILTQQSGVSPEMALRLSKSIGNSPESWLSMQNAYDLAQAKIRVRLTSVRQIKFNPVKSLIRNPK